MRILVTGGAGFIGSNLAKRLETDGHEVVVLDDFSSGSFANLVDFKGEVLTRGCGGVKGAGEPMPPPCDRCEVILHEASITDTTVTDQRRMMENNVEGFRNVLGWAEQWRARVVWASSAAVYGNQPAPNVVGSPVKPLNVYGYSKLAMERMAERWGETHPEWPIIGLRYFNVYGPGEGHKGKFASMIYQLAQQMKAGQRPRIFKFGEQRRDFVSIEDVVQANLRAMAADLPGAAVFNVGSGASHTFSEVIAGLNNALATKLEPEFIDNPYRFFQLHTEADIDETRQVLGYEPKHTNVADGILAYEAAGAL